MRRLLYYIAMAAGIWFVLGHVGPTAKYEQLLEAGVPAQATVVRRDCDNHASFVYHFEATGRRFESRDRASSIGRRCVDLAPDERVAVVYLPDDPSVNMAGSPGQELHDEQRSVALAALVMPGLILWAVSRRPRVVTSSKNPPATPPSS